MAHRVRIRCSRRGFSASAWRVLALQAVVRRPDRSSSTFAAANAFSFVLMGGLLFPTVPFFDENIAQTVVALVSGLSMLAGVVGFCLGRFIFVLVFVRA